MLWRTSLSGSGRCVVACVVCAVLRRYADLWMIRGVSPGPVSGHLYSQKLYPHNDTHNPLSSLPTACCPTACRPNNAEDYVHRIGRTGRAGATGTSYSFFTAANGRLARDIIKVLREANQVVPPALDQLAATSSGGGPSECQAPAF